LAASARFAALVQGPESDLPLDEAALLLAAHGDPALDVGAALGGLDALAARVPSPTAAGVRSLLFGELGLRGNRADYGDPRNSYLHLVIERRLGIPITLALAVIVVGRRVGVTFEGLGMPGHFLARGEGVIIDPFDGGRELDEAGCATVFRGLFGPDAVFAPELLAPVGPRAILARMLANLRQSFAGRGDRRGLEWSTRLALDIPGLPPAEVGELARLLTNLGRFAEAADALERLAATPAVPPGESTRLRATAASLRARLN